MCPAKPVFIHSRIALVGDCTSNNQASAFHTNEVREAAVKREVDRISVPSDIEAKWAALREAGKEFRGECKKCVHRGYASYGRDGCQNPLVVVPTLDPVNGELVYEERLCSDERSTLKSAKCGPSGKLFEPAPDKSFGWPSLLIIGAVATTVFALIRLMMWL